VFVDRVEDEPGEIVRSISSGNLMASTGLSSHRAPHGWRESRRMVDQR
jgi:hypothetical protein